MDSAVVEHLIDNVLSVVATEASLLWGVRDAIGDIKHELTSMRSLLIDADKKGASSAGEETWVTNVRNTAYDVEDVIDMFMYHISSQQIGGRFAWFLHHTIYIPQTLWVRHKIASKLQKINKTIIKTTSELNQKYHVDPIEGKSSEYFHQWAVRHDVWDTNVLDELKVSLRDRYPGSKIILTTRKDDVAHHPFMVKEKFGVVHYGGEEMIECKACRISIHKIDGEVKLITGMQAPSNIGQLKKLQTLCNFEAKGDLIRQIRSMTQLTSIGIGNVKEADEMDLCITIQNMGLLRVLGIEVTNEEETIRMDALSSPPPNLQKLVLTGKLEKVPQWFRSLQSLTYLLLHWSRLEEDLLPHIAALPHLGHLKLTNAYVGKQLCFSTGFLKLTSLTIRNLPRLNEIIVEKGVMPNLKSLDIISCMELNTVPKGIEYLQNLQELVLASVLMELQNRIEGEGSVDFPKVQHIPKIYIW
ncbi:hypothetical protein SO802_024836 [Lithocarpus litseifolius]|uniref:Rx N-terminal domain-containing protein n=1 Tax=Lithocarpus litseifolius TaxID=425828 RepID=A0AAW2CCC7_9ROSI